ncbi:hypothetical protein BCR39DRAFT_466331 [Naematelia encephala]|uniref:Phospholipid-transporting ATPase n=1 Tax=Naematelia encephala TaxID=71784 RepID=A0A1Y2B7K6_9TREE|nr:hypothetical protein BCR39DRAFT_466331 [Naematelia encephala]
MSGLLGGEEAPSELPRSRDKSRTIQLHSPSKKNIFPPNVVRNQKYTVMSFLPLVFWEQFKFFFNFYFLVVALSQFIPALKIGYIVTYVAPLAFVLAITMGKEAYDDYCRFLRDREANSTRYLVLVPQPSTSSLLSGDGIEDGGKPSLPRPQTRSTPSSSIRVGDMVLLEKNQRVPADMVLLTTSEEEGTCFIRTDQLDGETDWKLKVAVGETQKMGEGLVGSAEGHLYADPPIKDIHSFYGVLNIRSVQPGPSADTSIPLSVENVLWANTVLAAGSAVGLVVFTGKETRAVLNTSEPETKMGTLEQEVNKMAKILCTVTFALSVFLVALNGFRGRWYIYVFRFLILFSSIIPISLRVNLDMGKTIYAHQIQSDPEIPETIVRTSTLPEELGRVEYLLSDKTGTLTRNEMEMKKLHMGTVVFGWESMDEVGHLLSQAFGDTEYSGELKASMATGLARGRRDISSRVRDAVLALATCHNVTPVTNDDGTVTYQASSPDEVAIVLWTESVGLTLIARDRTSMTIRLPTSETTTFDILAIFPFTSESKRMGIVVRERESGVITFAQKGADVIMAKLVQKNDWLEEETGNMAREGLRTLVVARKRLSAEAYDTFDKEYRAAQLATDDRAAVIQRVVSTHLESELELLALTGVEDKLQEDVRSTLELLRNAGLKIWMLTGDKIETATNIAVSSKLVARGQYIHQVAKLTSSYQVRDMLDFLSAKLDCCLVIDGESLQLCLDQFRTEFVMLATQLPAVVACRCSPTQKADIARLIREFSKKTVCCIGDGGNDVSMIQAADVGIGIVGKEGKQASLAADFSINQFSYLTKLLLWHGRNSYKRSAKLSQFVIHRGLIIAVIQAVFSGIFFFAPIALYQGWLQVGYATLYTMAPVFSLVLDRDLNEDLALLYPELYKELTKGRSLSYKTFFTWLTISVYQGGIIMLLSLLLFESEFLHIVAISYTALVINELIMVALEITTWHTYMVLSELGTAIVYFGSMAVLPAYFDLSFVLSTTFAYKVAIIVAVSSFPLYVFKAAHARFKPAAYTKVAGI